MCIAAPGKVVKISNRQVQVEYPGLNKPRQAMLAIESVNIGDWVMVQMGMVVRVLTKKEASEAKKAWEAI